MLKIGDRVVFNIGGDISIYEVVRDEYQLFGKRVVDLKDYSGEVAVEYLGYSDFMVER